MFIIRAAGYAPGAASKNANTGKPDGMYVADNSVGQSTQKSSAKLFNTVDEAHDYYRDVVLAKTSHRWWTNKFFIVEVETVTKVVISKVGKKAVREL